MANAVMTDSVTAVVTYPVDVWFAGSRTFTADLDFGGRTIESVTLRSALPVPRPRIRRTTSGCVAQGIGR